MYTPMGDVGYAASGVYGVNGGGVNGGGVNGGGVNGGGVKHEIQIAQVSSLTSSPDSSPSPMATPTLAYPGIYRLLSHQSNSIQFNQMSLFF